MTVVEVLGQQVGLGHGRVDYLDPNFASVESFQAKEDLLQVAFGKTFLLDVGWYGGSGAGGLFRVVVIRDFDWEHPVFSIEAAEGSAMLEAVERGVTWVTATLEKLPDQS